MLIRHDVMAMAARAARAATATLLARLGHDVVLLDRAHRPSDTIPAHQIARTVVVAHQRWDLLDPVLASGTPASLSQEVAAALGAPPGEARIGNVAGAGGITRFPAWSIIHSLHWKMQIPYLARHCRVVTFDGHGNRRSDRPAAGYQRGHRGTLARLG